MESSSSDDEMNPLPIPEQEKKKRGPTRLTLGTKSKGKQVKTKLQFNIKGQPIGKSRETLSTDCGIICRSYAPINCPGWKQVPASLKAKMRDVIINTYKCKKTKNWQKLVMDLVRDRYRGFKHYLYKKFILPNLNSLDQIRDPPSAYSTITQDQWRDFVAQRTSKSWAKVWKKAQEVRSENKYPHRLSQKGYAGLEEQLQRERNTEEPIERHTLWVLGRQVDGAFLGDDVRKKAEEIDEIAKKVEEGSVIVDGSNDVLMQSFGTKEHSGRVRGVGHLVTPTSYFVRPHPSIEAFNSTKKEVGSLKKFIVALAAEVHRLGGQVPDGCPLPSPRAENVGSNSTKHGVGGLESQLLSTPPNDPSSTQLIRKCNKRSLTDESSIKPSLDKPNFEKEPFKVKEVDSCPMPPGPPNNTIRATYLIRIKCMVFVTSITCSYQLLVNCTIFLSQEKMRPCRLALGSLDRIVAHGHLHDIGGSNIIHGSPMAEGNARVSIDKLEKAEYELERLPVPNPDMNTLMDAVGGFLAWPRRLVIMDTTMGKITSSSRQKKEIDIVAANFVLLIDKATGNDKDVGIWIPVPHKVFQTNASLQSPVHEMPVFKDELLDVINFKEIGIAVMKLYMCALYNKERELSVDHKVRFVEPAGSEGHSDKSNAWSLLEALKTAQPDEIFLYPYNIGFHWVLVVIDPWHRHSIFLDPLGNEVDPTVYDTVFVACKNLNFNTKFSKSKQNPTIEKAMCPQQSGGIECGYYVMRYMRDIIHSPGNLPAQVFCNVETYGSELIDEVRLELMNFVRDKM